LVDDRDARPGVKFADADLVGIPHRLVVGERGVRDGRAEYRHRQGGNEEQVGLANVLDFLRAHRDLPRQG
ncbi:MAG: His/Gly/Thr/Pro-type tRNA ligase C-terminal domain-containing protein, partial [Gammaproteobacteria bacterium]|nr:His/Gly/Thr/Pro-type tRNA ligase C-terminal domain-containing protein [Gammaproteobacteria bacterium]